MSEVNKPRIRNTLLAGAAAGSVLLAASCAEPGGPQESKVIESVQKGDAEAASVLLRLNGEVTYRNTPLMPRGGDNNTAGTVNAELPIVIDKPVIVHSDGNTWYGFKKPRENTEASVSIDGDNLADQLVYVNVTQLRGQVTSDGRPSIEVEKYPNSTEHIYVGLENGNLTGTVNGQTMPVGEARIVSPAEADFFMQAATSPAGGK